jgi:patatin-like phospholipase/acyl hydrolase
MDRRAVFGERLLGDSTCRLVIPAFNAQSGKLHLFKTRHLSKYKQDPLERATDVALSTAAAPTYFSAYTTPKGGCYVDGGVWANCPAVIGILEAMCILDIPRERVRVLSIGTTTEPYSIGMAQRNGGKLAWAEDAPALFLQAQVGATLGMGELLVGSSRFRRIDETVAPGRFSLDSAKGIGELRALGEEAARSNEDMVLRDFLYAPADPFRPCEPTRDVAQ